MNINNPIDEYIKKAELLYSAGKFEESLYFYRQAIEINPYNATLYKCCGVLLSRLGRFDEAIISYKKSIKIDPEGLSAYKGIAYIFKELKKYEQAYFHLKKASDINPDYETYNNLGVLCCQMDNIREGIIYYDKAIMLEIGKSEAYCLKANAHVSEGEIEKAILSYDKALENEEDFSNLDRYTFCERRHLKNGICDWSNFEQDLHWLNLKIQKKKSVTPPLVLSSLLDSAEIQKLGAELFVHDKFSLDNSLGPINKYAKNKKIKIGYFSPDFSDHPVAYLVTELLEKHDKSKFELFAFSLSPRIESETRLRIEKPFDEFFDVENLSDRDVASLARQKKIDIAIDLAGYTTNSRPGIFSMNTAPIQINFLGYAGTTGSDYIDYNIADKFIIPKDLQKHYSEKIIYLPMCFQPNEERIPLGKRIFSRKVVGLPETGFIFCCFNNSWKIRPNIFKIWIRLLSIVDGSVLWFPAFSKPAINNLRNECSKLGIDQNRLIFSVKEKFREDYHAKIKLADILLDSFPYGAHTTASDFLRSGVPIVTLQGTSFASRVASSLLLNLNLSELVTTTAADYERLAIKLATNPKYLKEVKAKLIVNINTSSLFNIDQYTKSIESSYIQAYNRYHDCLMPDHINAT
jgi:predicted O-linked N-acetylglucosamine transferase (SPINDLY family)